jgi:peptidyl-prolyl cis-trans isomerase SurA
MEKEVWNKASDDTTGLRLFYESNKKKYEAGERVRAKVFAADDSAFVQAIQAKVTKGDSISRTELKKFKAVQGPRNFASGESKAVDRVSKSIGLHTVKVDGTFYLVQIDNLVPAGIRLLEEIRSQVISDYQDFLEKKWVASLRAKYPARINSKSKKLVVRELTKP